MIGFGCMSWVMVMTGVRVHDKFGCMIGLGAWHVFGLHDRSYGHYGAWYHLLLKNKINFQKFIGFAMRVSTVPHFRCTLNGSQFNSLIKKIIVPQIFLVIKELSPADSGSGIQGYLMFCSRLNFYFQACIMFQLHPKSLRFKN